MDNIQKIADALEIETYKLFIQEWTVITFTYEHFIDKLNAKIKSDESFIYELLVTAVKNPNRYTGIFRLSNAKTKLIQNVTQSREIKFGDFMEEICAYLLKNKQERSNEILYIPDFDTSEEIFLALKI